MEEQNPSAAVDLENQDPQNNEVKSPDNIEVESIDGQMEDPYKV